MLLFLLGPRISCDCMRLCLRAFGASLSLSTTRQKAQDKTGKWGWYDCGFYVLVKIAKKRVVRRQRKIVSLVLAGTLAPSSAVDALSFLLYFARIFLEASSHRLMFHVSDIIRYSK